MLGVQAFGGLLAERFSFLSESSFNVHETVFNFNRSSCFIFHLSQLLAGALVLISDTEFSHEKSDVDLIRDFLTSEEQIINLTTDSAEVSSSLSCIFFILRNAVLVALMLAAVVKDGIVFFTFNLLFLSILFVSSFASLIDQTFHLENIKAILFLDELGRNFLTSEGISYQAEFKSQPVGSLGMLQLGTSFKVQLNDLLKCISEQVVVGSNFI